MTSTRTRSTLARTRAQRLADAINAAYDLTQIAPDLVEDFLAEVAANEAARRRRHRDVRRALRHGD